MANELQWNERDVVFNLNDSSVWLFINDDWINLGGRSEDVADATTASKGLIQLSGDLGGQGSVATSPKLSNTGVQAGNYGEDGDSRSLVNSETFTVPCVVVDSKGRITSAFNKKLTLPAASGAQGGSQGSSVANLSGQQGKFGQQGNSGSSATAARSDHYHQLPSITLADLPKGSQGYVLIAQNDGVPAWVEPIGVSGAQGADGKSIFAWNVSTSMSNINLINGMKIGDYVINTHTAAVNIFGTSRNVGDIVQATGTTTGNFIGNIRGPVGSTGQQGPQGPSGASASGNYVSKSGDTMVGSLGIQGATEQLRLWKSGVTYGQGSKINFGDRDEVYIGELKHGITTDTGHDGYMLIHANKGVTIDSPLTLTNPLPVTSGGTDRSSSDLFSNASYKSGSFSPSETETIIIMDWDNTSSYSNTVSGSTEIAVGPINNPIAYLHAGQFRTALIDHRVSIGTSYIVILLGDGVNYTNTRSSSRVGNLWADKSFDAVRYYTANSIQRSNYDTFPWRIYYDYGSTDSRNATTRRVTSDPSVVVSFLYLGNANVDNLMQPIFHKLCS